MPITDLIVNGGFDSAGANWSGNDLETGNREFQFLGNGSQNRVAELDGSSSSISTTVMEQSFTVTAPTTTNLTLDAALRTASNGQAGNEGFRVEILDGNGIAIASSDFFSNREFVSAHFCSRNLCIKRNLHRPVYRTWTE